jgi:NitT/TauT family transport system substrate-binding protein
MITRRRAVIGTAAILAASPAPAVLAQTLTPVRYGSTPLIDGVPLFWAQQTGVFKQEGLDVTITKMASASIISTALVGGALDIGEVTAQPLINAHVHGVKLKIVWPNTIHFTGRPYNAAVAVGANFPYKTGKDLNNTTMSSAAVGDSGYIAARVFIDAAGGDSSTIKFVEVPFPALVAAVEAGRVIGGVTVDPFMTEGVKSGKLKVCGDLQAGFGPRLIQSTYSTTEEYLAKNHDVAVRFARVSRVAHEHMNTNKADLVTFTTQFTSVEPARQNPDATNFTVSFTPKDLQPWIDAAVKYKLLDKSFDASELFAKLL